MADRTRVQAASLRSYIIAQLYAILNQDRASSTFPVGGVALTRYASRAMTCLGLN